VFFTALMFLTRIPGPRWVGYDPERLARSTVYFPVVGAIVGGVGAGVLWAARLAWPVGVAVVLSTATTVWLTGAFHEDAVAERATAWAGDGGASRS
jgi:adenosylcobinamide-GDP ribazoletransferase